MTEMDTDTATATAHGRSRNSRRIESVAPRRLANQPCSWSMYADEIRRDWRNILR